MPLQETSGNVTTDAYGGGKAVVPNYIEDVFSTYLYTGATTAQTFVNGIDLATKGGMVWIKSRSNAVFHQVYDTARGLSASYSTLPTVLATNTTDPASTTSTAWAKANTDGFSLGTDTVGDLSNNKSGYTYASWTFRKQPKFFDVVTYTGNGVAFRNIAHNLGSVPGCIICKRTDSADAWGVWHRYDGTGLSGISLNATSAADYTGLNTNTSTTFCPSQVYNAGSQGGNDSNISGATYVAYLFAHNAGGFGPTSTDNVISCESFTTDASGNATVNLGYEPQLAILKRTSGVSNWEMLDNMRGWSQTGFKDLYANSSSAEGNTSGSYCTITSTGFTTPTAGFFYPSSTYIYIAIRRGPMKVPTNGTSVFAPVAQTGGGTVTTNFPVDLAIPTYRNISFNRLVMDRLRGGTTNTYRYLLAEDTGAETSGTGYGLGFDYNTSIYDQGVVSSPSYNAVYWNFRRAPSFFDEVCYTGTGTTGTTFAHNLGVVPEMMIVKRRASGTANWGVYHKDVGNTKALFLNLTNTPSTNYGYWNNTTPTSSVFTVGNITETNASGSTYVSYLFATCVGVSKVGSYTGNGSTQTINCGFTGGARFVLIKRTDSTGDWYVYDTARGMTTLTDPYLLMNSTAAESATLGSVTTVTTGFAVNASILAAINTNAASYIFLAIA